MNKIFHYRLDGTHDECAADEPWKQCLFNSQTNFDNFKTKPLVSIAGQPVISQHQSTYLTGRDTCHAHHFAKMLAGALLNGNTIIGGPNGSVARAATPVAAPTAATVLWIDTLHGPHDCVSLYQEMKQNFNFADGQFHLMCLDMLGVFREDFYDVIAQVEENIHKLRPTLVVIDDIDHFLPFCGINVASRFCHIFRDTLNHTETAFLMIGYNHLGKRASTTGNLGKLIFPSSTSIFSVTTQNGISHVRLVRSFNCRCIHDAEFIFAVGEDNMPHQLVRTTPAGNVSPTLVEQTTLNDIITQVIEPGQTVSPDELATRISKRQSQLNRIDRARTIIAQAASFGIIRKADDGSNHYTLIDNSLNNSVNTILTLPPHLSTSSDESGESIPSSTSIKSSESIPPSESNPSSEASPASEGCAMCA